MEYREGIKGFIVIFVIFGALLLYSFIKGLILKKRTIKSLERSWGDKDFKPNKKDDFSGFIKLFLENDEMAVDDKTYYDINMELVMKKLDRTMSFAGSVMMRVMARTLKRDSSIPDERYEKIAAFKNNRDLALKLRYYMVGLSRPRSKNLYLYLEQGLNIDMKRYRMVKFVAILPLITVASFFLYKPLFLFLLIASLYGNIYTNFTMKKEMSAERDAFYSVNSLYWTARKISEISDPLIERETNEIREVLERTKKLSNALKKYNYRGALQNDADILYDLINMVFIIDSIKFFRTAELINKNRDSIKGLIAAIGEIDAIIALADYDIAFSHFSKRGFSENIVFEEIINPLIENPVPYTLDTRGKNLMLTGSNASGKSTFLKTVALNIIFAETFGIIFGKKMSFDFYCVLSNMNSEDNISSGDSYFMAEAKGVKRIIDFSRKTDIKSLFLLDELFRGTNTAERVGSAKAVLEFLANTDNVVIVATHDMELVGNVGDKYEDYHFSEKIGEKDISYDFELRPGPTKTRNAIEILRILDYPDIVYKNASEYADEMG